MSAQQFVWPFDHADVRPSDGLAARLKVSGHDLQFLQVSTALVNIASRPYSAANTRPESMPWVTSLDSGVIFLSDIDRTVRVEKTNVAALFLTRFLLGFKLYRFICSDVSEFVGKDLKCLILRLLCYPFKY